MSLAKPFDTLLAESLATLTIETGIDHIEDDGIARALLEIPLQELADAWGQFSDQIDQLKLTTATSSSLDALGDFLGVPRKASLVSASSPRGMKFYTNAPAPSGGYVITAGTTVWAPSNAAYTFSTTITVTIPAGGTVAFTGITAPSAGSANASPYTLTCSNGPAAVLCTNIEAVAGSGSESDDQYRYRLMNSRSGINGVTPDALRTKLLAFPGVLDCTLYPLRRGTGTLDIFVTTEQSVPTPDTINAITAYAQAWTSAGISLLILVATPLVVDITLRLALVPGTSNPTQLQQSAQQLVADMLNSMSLGASIYPYQLTSQVITSSSSIIDAVITSMAVNGVSQAVDTITPDVNERIVSGRITVG